VSKEESGDALEATLREFTSGQKLFRRYTLRRTLGRGGMGVVWLARDDELERDVALKFLPELIVHDRAVLSDLKRETRRSLELTHKNIVRIYDFIHDQMSGCISMEYVDGDTLSNLRTDRPHKIFEPHEISEWVSQLCDALDYAHNHAKIVHRDLKPSNLMVNQRGELKVADFGIARSLSDSMSMLTMDRGKSGTLLYMSPQQLDGERGSHLDDVYSLGASVFELLTSKPPFYSGNVDRQIREKLPPKMNDRRKELELEGEPIDETWEEVVRKCLAKDPSRRPQSVSEVAKILSVPSPKTRRGKRVGEGNEVSKKWVGVFAGMAVLLFLGAAGWFVSRSMHKPVQQGLIATPAPPVPSVPQSTPIAAPAQAVGSAIVNTSPDGATITIDGKQQLSPATFNRLRPGRYPMRVELNGYETVEQQIEVRENQSTDLGTIRLNPTKPPETAGGLGGPKFIPNAIYTGVIRARGQPAYSIPVSIVPDSDLKSGRMTQTAKNGDVVTKFTGVWNGNVLQAVTNEVVSKPAKVKWEPESFALRFSDDGRNATYDCTADEVTYVADLTAQALGSSVVAKLSSIYKGTISGGPPLKIAFSGDRKSGTMTQTAKSGDVVVRFAGVWDGSILRAVTDEVVSKPAKATWEPESFILRFSEDGRSGSYECNADGKFYSAQLSAQ
jgi:serine/threonine protein kinase